MYGPWWEWICCKLCIISAHSNEHVNLLKVPSAPSQHVKYILLVELARISASKTAHSAVPIPETAVRIMETIKESSVD